MKRRKKEKILTPLDISCPLKFCMAKPKQACIDRNGLVMVESFHTGRQVQANTKSKDLVYLDELNGWVKRNRTTEALAAQSTNSGKSPA